MDRKKIASKAKERLGQNSVLKLTDVYKEANHQMKYSADDILTEIGRRIANIVSNSHNIVSADQILVELEGIQDLLKNR